MEKDLGEQLMEAGFTPFGDIRELTEDIIISKDFLNYIVTIDDISTKEKNLLLIEKRLKELKCKTNFRKMLRENEKNIKKETNNININATHNEIGDILLQEEKIVRCNNEIYIYDNGIYNNNIEAFEQKISNKMPQSTSRFRNEVYKYLQLKPTIKETVFDRESGVINFHNGLLDIKTGKISRHTPDFFSMNQIPVNINLDAPKVQAVDDVLDRLSCGVRERRQTLLEMIGYCMTTSVKLQKTFILQGSSGKNGKNTLLNIINELIGIKNISCVSFKNLNTNRFASSTIKKKLLNSGTEMPNDYIEDVENLKMWVTGDYINIEQKGKQLEVIQPYAKFIFCANELPRTGDKTGGFYRRLHIIPLEYTFTNKDANCFNFNELISKEALEYLSKISVEAYANMGENFSNYKESDNEINKYKIEVDNVQAFINDEEYITEIVEKNKVKFAKELYGCYKNYCKENQDRPIGRNKFYQQIEKSGLIGYIGQSNHSKTYSLDLSFFKK